MSTDERTHGLAQIFICAHLCKLRAKRVNLMISDYLINLTELIISNREINFSQAKKLISGKDIIFDDLLYCANKLRRHFHGDKINFCSIVNAKSGLCGEDCKFCAQSSRHPTKIKKYPLLSTAKIVHSAYLAKSKGAHGFSIVTSGKTINKKELVAICQAIKEIKKMGLYSCVSIGELNEEIAGELKKAGLIKYHHNLETSPKFFSKICTTHTYRSKIKSIQIAKKMGFQVCSGGIFGLGEDSTDRIELAFALRQLDVDSIPLNFFNPIPGTPLKNTQRLSPREILKIIAVYRFIFPRKKIVICGGREVNLRDLQSWMFYAGANATMLGNYLTTSGRPAEEDLQMIADLGLKTRQ